MDSKVSSNIRYPMYWSTPWVAGKVITGSPNIVHIQDFNFEQAVFYQDPPALNDEMEFNLFLNVGNYRMSALGITSNDAGIASVYLNGNLVGTMDWYSISQGNNVVKTFTFTNPSNGLITLRTKALSKNASSADYYIPINEIWICPQ